MAIQTVTRAMATASAIAEPGHRAKDRAAAAGPLRAGACSHSRGCHTLVFGSWNQAVAMSSGSGVRRYRCADHQDSCPGASGERDRGAVDLGPERPGPAAGPAPAGPQGPKTACRPA
jgi:hypothetical protein